MSQNTRFIDVDDLFFGLDNLFVVIARRQTQRIFKLLAKDRQETKQREKE